MKIGILAGRPGWHSCDLARAAERLDLEIETLDFERLSARLGAGTEFACGGVDLAGLDRLLVRTMPRGTLEGVVFRMDVLARLEARGLPVFNSPRSLECAIDKFLATARLAAAGLPVPPTAACERAADAEAAFEELGGDIVVKPLFGSEGRGVERIADAAAARARFLAAEAEGAVLYLQRYVPNPGHDLRVFVLGGEPAWWMRRVAADGFAANVARGARAERCELPAGAGRLAARAAEAAGVEIAGVDLLPDRQGNLWVLEVNAVPGWRALARVCGSDVAAAVLSYIRDRGTRA